MTEILELTVTIVLLVQTYLYGKKSIKGPMIGTFTTVLWVWWFALLNAWAMVFASIIIGLVHFRNYLNWRRDNS